MINRMKKVMAVLLLPVMMLCIFAGCGGDGETSSGEGEVTRQATQIDYTFRYDNYLEEHYYKHGIDMGFDSPEEYLEAANAVIANPDALTKTEKEDGDTVYYVKATNEFVVLSSDGYIRTYFNPDDGINYFNRQ